MISSMISALEDDALLVSMRHYSASRGEKFHGGASHTAPNPTPRKGVTAIVLPIRLRRYRGISDKK